MRCSHVEVEQAASVDLSVEVAGIPLKNPVLTASGTFGYGEEYARIFDVSRLGGLVAKAISLKPRDGNPPPRLTEVTGGILSACGLQNVGVHRFVREKMPYLRQLGIPIIVNVAGETIEEFVEVVEILGDTDGIAGIELNVSCPNVKNHGMAFGIDAEAVRSIVRAVKKVARWPVICKLTPNVTDIVPIAKAAEEAGADALSLINAPLGLAIDVWKLKPKLGNVTGGLTGPAIKPIALRMVWQVAKAVQVPVIGVGGITTWDDAVEFMLVGASAVEVGTAFFSNPMAGLEIIEGIADYLREMSLRKVTDIIGLVRC